jgi:hypothetical protein
MQRAKSKPRYKYFLIGIIIILLTGVIIVWYIFTEKFIDTAEHQSDFTVNSMDFIKEFQLNDSAANKKYIEKIVTVNGTVSEIEVADTSVNIKFIDSTSGDYVIFAFQQQHLNDAKTLQEGKQASIKGSCSGGARSEILGIKYISFKRAALNK